MNIDNYHQVSSAGKWVLNQCSLSTLNWYMDWIRQKGVTYTTYKTIHSVFHFHQNSFEGIIHIHLMVYVLKWTLYTFIVRTLLFYEWEYLILTKYSHSWNITEGNESLLICYPMFTFLTVHADIYQVREGRPTRSCHGGPKGIEWCGLGEGHTHNRIWESKCQVKRRLTPKKMEKLRRRREKFRCYEK